MSPCVLRVLCHLVTLILLVLDTICEARNCVLNIRRTPVSKYRANILLILSGNWNWGKFTTYFISGNGSSRKAINMETCSFFFLTPTCDLNKYNFIYFLNHCAIQSLMLTWACCRIYTYTASIKPVNIRFARPL